MILENDRIKVIVMPDLGAKIWEITYKPRSKDFLWHNPRIKPRQLPFHSVYDDQFFGGWDELFPYFQMTSPRLLKAKHFPTMEK